MRRGVNALLGIFVYLALLTYPVAAENPAVKAMQDYLDFATYEAGIIVPQQLSKDVFEGIVFIDTRDAGQFAKGTIPGARNIEWREVLTRIGEIPKDKKVVLFCNTGSLSAQAAFALRVAGRDNVLVLQTGIDGWRKDAPFKP
jgi:rhodanese-related sulfurtransferase